MVSCSALGGLRSLPKVTRTGYSFETASPAGHLPLRAFNAGAP